MRFLGRLRTVALLCLLGSSLHCSDDSGPEDLAECSGPVALTATAGTVPSFSWTPQCRLAFVLVEAPEGGGDVWFIFTPGQNALVPPVTYGELPAGAEEIAAPEPLQAGVTYEVIVARWIGPGDDDGENIGSQSFTP
jgi:hypothetical protein